MGLSANPRIVLGDHLGSGAVYAYDEWIPELGWSRTIDIIRSITYLDSPEIAHAIAHWVM